MNDFFDLQRFQNFDNITARKNLNGTSDSDSIKNSGPILSIKAGAGDDTIDNSGMLVTIQSGAGNDSIYNTGEDVKIYGDAGNDIIRNNSNNVSIYGGDGNDSIYNEYDEDYDEKSVFVSSGNGDDTIINTADTNITLSSGAGNDYIYDDGGGDNRKNISISGGVGDDTIEDRGSFDTINAGVGSDIVSLCGDEGYLTVQYTYGDGDDTIFGFDSTDTLQITTPKKFSTMKGGDNLYFIFDNGSIVLTDVTTANVVTIKGGNSSGGGSSSTVSGDTLPAGISVKNGIVTASKKFTGSKIDLADYSNATKVNASAVTKNISIVGSAKNNSLKGGSGADTLSGGKGNDILTGGNGKDVFIYTAGKDVITDYQAGIDKIKISSSFTGSVKGSDVILKVGSSGSITVKGAADKAITFLNKNNKSSKQTFSDSGDLDDGLNTDNAGTGIVVNSDYTKNKIDLADFGSALVNIDASAISQKIYLVGNAKNNELKGGKSDDTLQGNSGSDTLTGGDGSDIFMHYEGNDVITDYKPGTDIIYLDETEITGAKTKVKDVILSTTNGSITIQNAKNKQITIIDSEGNETTKTYGNLPNGLTYSKSNTVLIASKKFIEDNIDLSDYAETVKKVDASKTTNDVEIKGNKLANVLIGGKGSDILFGGRGNDTLTGNGGEDIFVHNTGSDVITDYTAGKDKIQLDNTTITKVKVSNKNIVFTTSTGSITVKNGKNKNITVVDSEGESKIYKNTKVISSLWFEENNFSQNNLSEIVAGKSVGEFENISLEKVTQENLITYSK